jgi:hypothetical protein
MHVKKAKMKIELNGIIDPQLWFVKVIIGSGFIIFPFKKIDKNSKRLKYFVKFSNEMPSVNFETRFLISCKSNKTFQAVSPGESNDLDFFVSSLDWNSRGYKN